MNLSTIAITCILTIGLLGGCAWIEEPKPADGYGDTVGTAPLGPPGGPLGGGRIEPKKPGEDGDATPRISNDTVGRDDPALIAVKEMMQDRAANVSHADPDWRTKLKAPQPLTFPEDSTYYWTLRTTHGTMKFRLRPDLAPMHVTNTIYLTRLGFYDGLGFHRVIPGFMAQGGCPLGNGAGNPGYRFGGEIRRGVSHDGPGVLSTANAGPRTDGSQFFITLQRAKNLDGRHTIFGKLVEGMDTLRKIERLGSRTGRPSQPIVIRKALVTVAQETHDPLAWRAEGSRGPLDANSGSTATGGADATGGRKGQEILAEIDRFIASMKIDRADDRWRTRLPRPPKYTFPIGYRYVWHIKTNHGPLEVTLWPHVAPMHVSNTIYLARLGFYDGLGFHRVIPGFVAQGGCPIGDGNGTPGYRFESQPRDDVRHDRPGLLGMATAGPDQDGCQFYLTLAPTPTLEGSDTIFGEVTAGLETLERIGALGQRSGDPVEPILIEKTLIEVIAGYTAAGS